MVPNTDNHKIRKTYKKGEKIDEDVTVYQNKTGDSDKTHVKYTFFSFLLRNPIIICVQYIREVIKWKKFS